MGTVRWADRAICRRCQAAASQATQALTIFLILRAFSGGCSAMTGTEAISNAVPAFKPPESRRTPPSRWGSWPACWRSCFIGVTNLTHVVGRAAQGGRHRAEPGGPGRLREQRVPLLWPSDRHHGHPLPGGQHQLRRVSSSGLHPGPGRLSSAPIGQQGRPPGVLQRDHRPGSGGHRPARGLRRLHPPDDPPVRGGSVHLVHVVAVGDGAALVACARQVGAGAR